MARRRSIRFTLALTAIAALMAGTVFATSPANFRWRDVVVVPAGLTDIPNDLHLTYTGTGGSIKNEVLVAPAGAIAVSGGNTLDITWGAKQAVGTVVTVEFTTEFKQISRAGGTWTNADTLVGNVVPGEPKWLEGAGVPGASTNVLIALAVLMLGVGVFALRRRRAELA